MRTAKKASARPGKNSKKSPPSGFMPGPEEVRHLFDVPDVIFVILDTSGRIKFANRNAADTIGMQAESLAGRKIFDFIPSKYRKDTKDGLSAAYAGDNGVIAHFENRVINPRKGERRIEWRTSVMKGTDGSVTGIVAAGTDVTLDRLAQAELIRGEERYRNLFNSLNESMIIYERDGSNRPLKILEVNDNACRTLGYTRMELSKLVPSQLEDPAEAKRLTRMRNADLAKNGRTTCRTMLRRKDGTLFPAEMSLSLFSYRGENAVIATAVDLTEEHKAKLGMEKSEEKYRNLFDAMSDLVLVMKYDTEKQQYYISEVNESVRRILGYSRQEFTGKKSGRIFKDINTVIEKKQHAELMKNGRAIFERKMAAANGETVLMEIQAQVSPGPGGHEIVAVCRDITERKRQSEMLAEQNKFNKVRAVLLEKSAFFYAEEEDLIAEFLGIAAQALGCSRALWSLNRDGLISFPVEWAAPGRSKVLGGVRIPSFVEDNGQFNPGIYNTDNVLQISGGIARAALRPVLKFLAKKLGVTEAMAVPCLISGRLAGTFVCASAEEGFWTFERQQFAKDAARIIGMAMEKKLLIKKTSDSEERYRMIFNNTSDAILVNKLGPDGMPTNFESVNDVAVKRMGYTAEQFTKFGPLDLLRGLNVHDIKNLLQEIAARDIVHFESKVVDSGGKEFPVEVSLHKFIMNNEVKLVSSVKDISERLSMEAALKNSEHYFRVLTEESSDLIVVLDRTGMIKYASQASKRLLSYEPAELEKMRFTDLIPAYMTREAKEQFDMLVSGTLKKTEMRARTSDNKLAVFDVTCRNLTGDPSIGGVVLNLRDITDRKRSEDKMKKIIWQLEHSNQELEQFAYVASHDLKEPLRMISNYLELIHMRHLDELSGETREFMDYAMSGTKRMYELIQALLTYSRIGRKQSDVANVDLNGVMDIVRTDFSVSLNGGTITCGELPVIRCNKVEISQLLHNLVGNAVKFRSEQPLKVEVNARKDTDEEEWHITVADNGIGIEEKYLERIFGLFERLHSETEYPGTGIGLTICKKIVENLGGRIWMTSVKGQGTTAHFTIPIRRETNE